MLFRKNLLYCLKTILYLGKLSFFLSICFLALCSSINASFCSFFKRAEQHSSKISDVRVLLDTVSISVKDPIQIGTSGSYMRISSAKTKVMVPLKTISVAMRRGSPVIQGKAYSSPVVLESDGHLIYAGNAYHGTIKLLVRDKALMVINQVPLEDYICSVLKTESWPGWPLEVNKVFAVTSRTYVLNMMGQAQKVQRPYDVYNTKKHQTYSGVHDKQILRDAVEQTKGMILTYGGKPILAMFDSCCGGVIPARMHEVNFDDAPYLARTYPCIHCKPLWIFNWKAAFTTQELAERLFKDEKRKPKICSLRITKKDPAGLIHELEINAGKKRCISGKEFYTALYEVKSFVYTVKQEKNKILFQGRGYGHHIGLCQWGAREMVRSGWSYKRILHFYYPGTRLVRI